MKQVYRGVVVLIFLASWWTGVAAMSNACEISTVIDWSKQPVKYGEEVLKEGMPEAAEPTVYNRPHRPFVAPDGTIYVADPVNRRILIFDSDGKYSRQIQLGSASDKNAKRKYIIPAITVDANGRVYVANSSAHDIEIYASNGTLLNAFPYFVGGLEDVRVEGGQYIYLYGPNRTKPAEVLTTQGVSVGLSKVEFQASQLTGYSPYQVRLLGPPVETKVTLMRDGKILGTCRVPKLSPNGTEDFTTRSGDYYYFAYKTGYDQYMNLMRIHFRKKADPNIWGQSKNSS